MPRHQDYSQSWQSQSQSCIDVTPPYIPRIIPSLGRVCPKAIDVTPPYIPRIIPSLGRVSPKAIDVKPPYIPRIIPSLGKVSPKAIVMLNLPTYSGLLLVLAEPVPKLLMLNLPTYPGLFPVLAKSVPKLYRCYTSLHTQDYSQSWQSMSQSYSYVKPPYIPRIIPSLGRVCSKAV
ncbi:hypothetical protein PoB_000571100 [Plakobranchus ocellatus]|uniref:Uncharacterized protein n=1 Tax=Plakobranchus ocellatus TaxID=259542 RepID=A0AAV3XW45_9GAST|nr:hypothetical protein PoB_000571100 [Plakobranchus ocellatus]